MNQRQAKRLRRESRYHPRLPRRYVFNEYRYKDKETGKIITVHGVELHPEDRRVLYQELKKEYYGEKSA